MATYRISGNMLSFDVIKGLNLHKFLTFVGTKIYWGPHILRRSSFNGATRFILFWESYVSLSVIYCLFFNFNYVLQKTSTSTLHVFGLMAQSNDMSWQTCKEGTEVNTNIQCTRSSLPFSCLYVTYLNGHCLHLSEIQVTLCNYCCPLVSCHVECIQTSTEKCCLHIQI